MKTILTFLFTISITFLFAQLDTVYFSNPSFEGNPFEGGRLDNNLRGCIDCGFRGETPFDVHPVPMGNFSVSKQPVHGLTYIGMVVRDNDTWESTSQNLSKSIKAGKCYKLSVALARSDSYVSQSRMTNKRANYITPVTLRIHGGDNYCDKDELLVVSPLIKNHDWLQYEFIFSPKEDYKYITLEAFYNTPTLYPYNGNILVDNLSTINEIACDSDTMKVKISEIEKALQEHSKALAEMNAKANSSTFQRVNYGEDENLKKIQIEEKRRLAKERSSATLILVKEKLNELTKTGLFKENENSTKPEGEEVFEQIIKLLKANPRIGVDIALKKKGGKKALKWRKFYLEETLLANAINPFQFEIDKISRYESSDWPIENKILAISAFISE